MEDADKWNPSSNGREKGHKEILHWDPDVRLGEECLNV